MLIEGGGGRAATPGAPTEKGVSGTSLFPALATAPLLGGASFHIPLAGGAGSATWLLALLWVNRVISVFMVRWSPLLIFRLIHS
jgi:hypothetical protein